MKLFVYKANSFLFYNVFMKNPMKKFKTIKGACKKVGFDVVLPARFKLKDIYVISNKILELRYSSVVVRKAKHSKESSSDRGISGVYSGAYPNDCYKGEFEEDGIKGWLYWNGSAKCPKAYLAIFDDLSHKYSYSVYAPKGIKLKSMSKWQKNFR